ncbi:proton-conducting transporter membrane subunit, partial [Erythrobacter sp.]|nr:proton-conducting transporter membrane subunit [Erythrobacter sp.]
MDFAASFALIVPELILVGAGLALLLVAAWGGDKAGRFIAIAAVSAFFAAGLMLIPGLHFGTDGPEVIAFGGLIRVDTFALFAKALIYLAAIACLIVAPAFFNSAAAGVERGMRAEYPVLILFAALGMSIMVSASDFMTLYLGLELNSLASYVLAAILRRDARSAEAGLKYFVLGALASGILLYGMSL